MTRIRTIPEINFTWLELIISAHEKAATIIPIIEIKYPSVSSRMVSRIVQMFNNISFFFATSLRSFDIWKELLISSTDFLEDG